MQIAGTTALVTGAGRGLGAALVEQLLARGAAKVYATARRPDGVQARERVEVIGLDVTDPSSVATAAALAGDVRLLVNNAGSARFGHALAVERSAVEEEFAVNFFGQLEMVRAFLPSLQRQGGAVVNLLSLLSYAPAPPMAGYSAAKAAAASLTQSLRADLAPGITVHGVYPGGIDTEMLASSGNTTPKTSAVTVAKNVLAGVEAGDADIYPDPTSVQSAQLWASDPRSYARLVVEATW